MWQLQDLAHENHKVTKHVFAIEEFYDTSLFPQYISSRKPKAAPKPPPPPPAPASRCSKRKKHQRRTANEIDRDFNCPYTECGRFYGSEGSLNLHIKIKHNGGSKTDREKLAKLLVKATVTNTMLDELKDGIELNLPPGTLSKAAKKAGLNRVSESEIMRKLSNIMGGVPLF